MHEPPGHRGHPTDGEVYRSRGVRERVQMTIAILENHGFKTEEAIAFISGVCTEVAREHGSERWMQTGLSSARRSLEVIIAGGASKNWVMDIVDLALPVIHDLLREENQ